MTHGESREAGRELWARYGRFLLEGMGHGRRRRRVSRQKLRIAHEESIFSA